MCSTIASVDYHGPFGTGCQFGGLAVYNIQNNTSFLAMFFCSQTHVMDTIQLSEPHNMQPSYISSEKSLILTMRVHLLYAQLNVTLELGLSPCRGVDYLQMTNRELYIV